MIKNIKKEDVFKLLTEGNSVYAMNRYTGRTVDLFFEAVNFIRTEYIGTNNYEYFIIVDDMYEPESWKGEEK